MPFRDPEHGKRRFYVIAAVLAGTLVFVTVLTISFLDYRSNQAAKECRRLVEARDDGRAMWLRTFERLDPDRADETVEELRLDLDELLPRLECVDSVPTPDIPVETGD